MKTISVFIDDKEVNRKKIRKQFRKEAKKFAKDLKKNFEKRVDEQQETKEKDVSLIMFLVLGILLIFSGIIFCFWWFIYKENPIHLAIFVGFFVFAVILTIVFWFFIDFLPKKIDKLEWKIRTWWYIRKKQKEAKRRNEGK